MIQIRPARLEDTEAMSRVLTASITVLCKGDHSDDPEALAGWIANKTVDGVRSLLAVKGLTVLVAERDGDLAAVGAFAVNGMIALNYVDPTHRFLGVSRALLVAMENALRGMGVGEARLVSTGTALRFYRSAGWQDAGPAQTQGKLSGYPMSKRL